MARDSSTKKKHQMNNMCNKKLGNEGGNSLGKNPKTVNITAGELGRIEKALKQDEFRKLLVEYANEVQDPKSKENYEADIIKLEAERGIKCTFLRPQPGHVVKARHLDNNNEKIVGKNDKSEVSKSGGKAFINICWDPNVAKPESKQAVDGSTGKSGIRWSVPYCQSRPRQETDSKGIPCDVYDVIFHPEAGVLASKDPRMKDLLNTTAVDAIEKAFGLSLDRKNLKSPKLKYKGQFRPTVIREPFGSNSNTSTELKTQDAIVDTISDLVEEQASVSCKTDDVKQPEYTLKYKNTHVDLDPAPDNILSSSDPCRPTELVVEIHLPEMTSAKGVDLDVLERQLTLNSMEPERYHLNLRLPYPVDEEAGGAKFDKSSRMLIVTLPVKPGQNQKPVVRVVSTDSGIGLDMEEKRFSLEQQPINDDIPDIRDNQESEENVKENVEKFILPNYTSNIYEEFMVFKLDVKNVDPDSLVKDELILREDKEAGFSLSFVNIGAGMVPMKYGFKMAFVLDEANEDSKFNKSILEDMEVEVWDNNIIVQLALPQNCKQYKVGSCIDDMKEYPLNHPLRNLKKKMDKIKNSKSKTTADLDGNKKAFSGRKIANAGISSKETQEIHKNGDDKYGYSSSEEEKERHSSGESVDSCYSECTPSESDLESLNDEKPGEYGSASTENNDKASPDKSKGNFGNDQDGIYNTQDSKTRYESDEALQQQDDNCDSKCGYYQPRGILKRCVRRCFSESHATSQANSDNLAWSNAIFEAITSPMADSSSSSASSEDGRMNDDVTAQKKSVRFNEVVQRQIFRSNSSILKQKKKNEKRQEHKLKKRVEKTNLGTERRASEGDAESFLDAGFKLSSSFEKSLYESENTNGYSSSENGSVSPCKSNGFQSFNNVSKKEKKFSKTSIQYDDADSHTDSGVASSYDEHTNDSPSIKSMEKIPEEEAGEVSSSNENASKPSKKSKKKKNKLARGKSQQQGQFIKESNTDLIFDLDF